MSEKKLSDIVFKEINPPDYKTNLSSEDLAEIIVQRLGLQRKVSRAKHSALLLHLLHKRRESIPVTIDDIAKVLEVSVSQAYEEIRKWRTIGVLEMTKVPLHGTNDFMKGYMLSANNANQIIDKAASSVNVFIRRTKRIAKDFDDQIAAEVARSSKAPAKTDTQKSTTQKDEADGSKSGS